MSRVPLNIFILYFLRHPENLVLHKFIVYPLFPLRKPTKSIARIKDKRKFLLARNHPLCALLQASLAQQLDIAPPIRLHKVSINRMPSNAFSKVKSRRFHVEFHRIRTWRQHERLQLDLWLSITREKSGNGVRNGSIVLEEALHDR